MIYPFMAVVADCLEATHHQAEFVGEVREAFADIAAQRRDLVDRYDEAFPRRDAGEIERLLIICQALLDEREDLWIGNLRINAVTKRLFIGTGRSVPLFPYRQGI
ncbi:MAG TPA: hypothetical protein VEC11_03385 [Allosphingosinicella sp.]|nr:hypothetical protein [Allosphingosinicella sp.]